MQAKYHQARSFLAYQSTFVDMSQVSRNVVSPFMTRATKSSQLVLVDVTQSPSDMLGHVVTPAEMSFSIGVPSVDIPESAADLWRSRFETGVFDLTAGVPDQAER